MFKLLICTIIFSLTNISNERVVKILSTHDNHHRGIDVSEYQSDINWSLVKTDNKNIKFAYIRSTAGTNKTDKKFTQNWIGTKKHSIKRGAYHYYRPDEDPKIQAYNFIKNTPDDFDLPPVLDIERKAKTISSKKLIKNLKLFLYIVENHYKVKPIIYSYSSYYHNYLKNEFTDHDIWLADYRKTSIQIDNRFTLWQFTDSSRIDGIKGNVDMNILNTNASNFYLNN